MDSEVEGESRPDAAMRSKEGVSQEGKEQVSVHSPNEFLLVG